MVGVFCAVELVEEEVFVDLGRVVAVLDDIGLASGVVVIVEVLEVVEPMPGFIVVGNVVVEKVVVDVPAPVVVVVLLVTATGPCGNQSLSVKAHRRASKARR